MSKYGSKRTRWKKYTQLQIEVGQSEKCEHMTSIIIQSSLDQKFGLQKYPVYLKLPWIGNTSWHFESQIKHTNLKVRLNTFVAMLLKEYKKVKLITLAMLTDQEHIRRKFTSTRLLPYTMENDLSERGSLLKLSNVSRTFSCKTFYYS